MDDKSLSSKEQNRLSICEKTISDGLQTCFDVGLALIEIKDFKLYRETFETFEDYCRERYQIEKSHAYRLIAAAEVKESLPASAARLVTNERQARALSEVPKEERADLLKSLKRDGDVTARAITESRNSPMGDKDQPIESSVSQKIYSKTKPPIQLDETGFKIPADALPYWNRRQEIQDVLTQLSRIKSLVEKAKSDHDCLYGRVSNAVIADLTKAYTHISDAKPYAVCTQCQGSPSLNRDGCEFCGSSGMISKWRYETQSRKEVKIMRLKQVEMRP